MTGDQWRWYRGSATPAYYYYFIGGERWRSLWAARAVRQTVLSLDLSWNGRRRTTRETRYSAADARPSTHPGGTAVIDDGGRRWQGVARLIRRVERRFRCRQIGRHPASMCPRPPPVLRTESQGQSGLVPRSVTVCRDIMRRSVYVRAVTAWKLTVTEVIRQTQNSRPSHTYTHTHTHNFIHQRMADTKYICKQTA